MRDIKIDALRFIGLSAIILAHITPPPLLFQLRNFDVPLMVLVSGISFALSYSGTTSYLSYVWKRIKRLVLPVWLFLSGYFCVSAFLPAILPNDSSLPVKRIINHYSFLDGGEPTWIFRVFLLVALFAPVIYKLNQKIKSDRKYMIFIFAFCLMYGLFLHFSMPYLGLGRMVPLIGMKRGAVLASIIHYGIAYALVFACGLRIHRLSRREVGYCLLTSFAIFAIYGLMLTYTQGKFMPTQAFKYPPSVYYLSYSLFVSYALWLVRSNIVWSIEKIKLLPIALFMARNSLWVYLWHIPLMRFVRNQGFYHFSVRYLIVMVGAAAITYCQVWVVHNVILVKIRNYKIQRFLKSLLTG